MSVRSFTSTQARSLETTLNHIRLPFRPKFNPSRKLADEIESSKRKIWECIDPLERQRFLEKKKQKKSCKLHPIAGNEENGHQLSHNQLQTKQVVAPTKSTTTTSPVDGDVSLNIAGTSQFKAKTAAIPSRADVEFKVNAMKVVELKRELKKRGCETSGLKKDLRSRLLMTMMSETNAQEKVEKTKSESAVVDSSTKAFDTVPATLKPKNYDQMPQRLQPNPSKDSTYMQAITEPSKSVASSVVAPTESNTKSLGSRTEPASTFVHSQDDQSKQLPQPKESISSMQVEHHTSDSKSPKDGSSDHRPQAHHVSSDSSSEDAVASASSSSVPFGKPEIIDASSAVVATSSAPVPMVVDKIDDPKVPKEEDEDISPPASEVSACTMSSAKSVKEMVSKFSTFSSLSSASSGSGSALSKGLQAKRDARLARNAEIREMSKPISTSKVALASKEYTSTLSSLKATAAIATAKKQTLAAQMREKAAANAVKKDNPQLTKVAVATTVATKPTAMAMAKSVLSSAQMSNLPFSQGLVQDSLGSTLKGGQSSAWKRAKVQSPLDTYEISDREDSETDDSDSEAESSSKPKKKIPGWASRANLMSALEQQYNGRGMNGQRVDPDDIFPEVQSCNLEAIFGHRKAKYRTRTSSGNWTRDKVTVAEKLVYKRNMGFSS